MKEIHAFKFICQCQQIIINQSKNTKNYISKYKDLEIEIEKCSTLKLPVSVIEEVWGRIKKGTDKYFNKIPGSPSIHEIQEKIALCRTAHLRRVLLVWLKNNTQDR